MMQQSEGHWQQYLCLVVWKLARDGVTITAKDIQEFAEQNRRVLLTHGHIDSIDFKLVTMQDAARLAAYDKKQGGTA